MSANKMAKRQAGKLHIVSESMYGQCRCCLKYAPVRFMWEQYKDANTAVEVYGKMLVDCYSISWTIVEKAEDDKICESCIIKLRDAISFKNEVLHSQESLLQIFQAKEPNDQGDQDTIVIQEQSKNIKQSKKTPKEKKPRTPKKKAKKSGTRSQPQFNYVIPVIEDNNSFEIPLMRKNDPELYKIPFIRKKDETQTVPQPIIIKTDQDVETTDQEMQTDSNDVTVPENEVSEEMEDPYQEVEFLEDAVEGANENKGPSKKKRKVIEKKVLPEPKKDVILEQHRDNIRSILLTSNATPIRGYWGNGYACSFCSSQFPSASDLKQHTFTHEETPFKFKVRNLFEHVVKLDVTNLQCNICNISMNSLVHLMQHIKKVHEMPVHLDIPNHIVPFKFDDETLVCVDCGNEFDSFKTLSEHMSDVHYRNYECADPSCGKGFVNFQSLKTHSISHGICIVASSVCGKVYSSKQQTIEHEKEHQSNVNLKCSYENKEFTEQLRLKLAEDRKVQVPCTNCLDTFDNPQDLLEHVKSVHIEHKFKCMECDKSFFLKQGLKNHILQEHSKKEFRQCPICPVLCNSFKAMKDHMLTHRVENTYKFQCEVCQVKFQLETNYLGHMANEHGFIQ